jgi:drug/metabolite transporter (DMT)-like permease
MLGVLLALSSSLMWGFADYLGGLQTRSRQVLSVVLISQASGLVMIAAIVALRGVGWPGAQAMLPAAVAGVMGAFCIVTFYLALSYGPVSIVAPVLASSACIPVVYGLARGERPSALQLAGLVATLAGVMLVSWTDGDGHARGRRGMWP